MTGREVAKYRLPNTNVADFAYPAEIRESAYQLWAYVCNRNAAQVARILNGEEEPPDQFYEVDFTDHTGFLDEHPLQTATVLAWAKRDRWLERISRDARDLAPENYAQVIVTFVAASTEAAHYLREVVNNPKVSTKDRVDAAKTILDRSGHLPFNRPPDDSRPNGPGRDYSGAIAGLSDEEIARRLFMGDAPSDE